MNLIINSVINIYSILLLIVIYIQTLNKGEKRTLPHQLFILMVQVTMLLLFFDIFGRFDGQPGTIYPLLNSAGNFIIFLLQPVLPSLWFLYAYHQIYNNKEKLKRTYIPLLCLNLANVAMVIASQFTGWYYMIDAANIYHRGPFYSLSYILTLGLLFVTTIFVIANRKKLDKRYFFSLIFFAVPPFAGMILQMFFYGISFALSGVVLSLLIVILNVQNQSIYTDFLTGIGNRTKLEAVLEEKINISSKNRTFSLVMVDVDNFKNINDRFGHSIGDDALKTFTQLLKKSIRSKDYITRFGGDEFCLILDISDEKSLEIAVCRIRHNVTGFNATSQLPYELNLSVGYAVYDYYSGLSGEEFLKQVDMLMYRDKNKKDHDETPPICL